MPKATSVFSTLSPAKTTLVYDTYWNFAFERQNIFFRRLENPQKLEWTKDPILKKHKFTNAYRASDRVSQYLIKNVIYSGDQSPEEVFFRTILFKLFNRIETWELLERELGVILYSEYDFRLYDNILTRTKKRGEKIYSGAYIMPSGASSFGSKYKHRNNLRLLEKMMDDELPSQIASSTSMKQAFELIRAYPTIGDFLAYQFVTDLNYSEMLNFSETEFVVPGPGALSGLKKCFSSFGGYTPNNLIRLVMDRQHVEFEKRGLKFKSLWGRDLHLIDCQNLFCEVDKYARVAYPDVKGNHDRTRIKQQFRYNTQPISYWYPPKWGINEKLNNLP